MESNHFTWEWLVKLWTGWEWGEWLIQLKSLQAIRNHFEQS